jgi:hypothetical protein
VSSRAPVRWWAALSTLIAVASAVVSASAWLVAAVPAAQAAAEVTACHDAALARRVTDVDADLTLPQFDPALGTLLGVSVPSRSVHLDTDAVFESTASSSIVMAEHMTYEATFTSPAGLASPPAMAGSIDRVPAQTVPAFDGTLDFSGPSSVTQSPTSRDLAAAAVQSTSPAVLAAFTGPATVPLHLATTVDEHFTSGGGNVAFLIHTFVSAAVTVCYRYSPAPVPEPTTVPPAGGPVVPVVDPPAVPVRFTG